VVLCGDDPVLARLGEQLGSRATSFGLHPGARFTAEQLSVDADGSAFTAKLDSSEIGRLALESPGEHGVIDALAALAAAHAAGLSPEVAVPALDGYRGVARRFQKLGEARGVQVIDDYAHHPAEIIATLDAARAAFPGARLIAVFQPHLYSRTRDHLQQFAVALTRADRVVVTGIYAAREDPIPGVSGEAIVAEMELRGGPPAYSEEQREAVAPHVARMVRAGDVVLLLGAGDIWRSGEELLALLRQAGDAEDGS
jgi:UDP-N-acetylmuramate--alanine ligase